jgi:hypothetical protein
MKANKLNEIFYRLKMWADKDMDLELPDNLDGAEKAQYFEKELRRRACEVTLMSTRVMPENDTWQHCLDTALSKTMEAEHDNTPDMWEKKVKTLVGLDDPEISGIDKEDIDRTFGNFTKTDRDKRLSGVNNYRRNLAAGNYTAEECFRHLAVIKRDISHGQYIDYCLNNAVNNFVNNFYKLPPEDMTGMGMYI